MKNPVETTQALVAAGNVRAADTGAAVQVLEPFYKDAANAADMKAFARQDKAYQAGVIDDALDLAEADVKMGNVEDRFIQAAVIDSATALEQGDEAALERADALLVAACTEAAVALMRAGLVKADNLEVVTRLIARLWNDDLGEKLT